MGLGSEFRAEGHSSSPCGPFMCKRCPCVGPLVADGRA